MLQADGSSRRNSSEGSLLTLSYDHAAHEYRAGERRQPSVTEILQVYGDDVARWAKPKHRQRGEAVHRACRYVDAGTYDEAGTHDEIKTYPPRYKKFTEDHGFKALAWELVMICPELGFGGTLDILGTAYEEFWLVDLKTGTIPPLVGAQLSGYELLLRRGQAVYPTSDIDALMARMRGGAKLKRKVLNLAANSERDRLRAYDEPVWTTRFLAALTVCNTKKEFGL